MTRPSNHRAAMALWAASRTALLPSAASHPRSARLFLQQQTRFRSRAKLPLQTADALRYQRKGLEGGNSESSLVDQHMRNMYQLSLAPGTFIPMPWTRMLGRPRELLKYQWLRFRAHLSDAMQRLAYSFQSKPGWFKRATFRSNDRLTSIATALHKDMNLAFAAGDKTALEKVCCPTILKKYAMAVEKRPPNQRQTWEVIKYHNSWRLPRVLANRIAMWGDPRNAQHCAVVTISTTQKLTKTDGKTGEVLPDGIKVQRLEENVAMTRHLNMETHQTGPWRIWGLVSYTTIETWEEDLRQFMAVTAQQGMKRLDSL